MPRLGWAIASCLQENIYSRIQPTEQSFESRPMHRLKRSSNIWKIRCFNSQMRNQPACNQTGNWSWDFHMILIIRCVQKSTVFYVYSGLWIASVFNRLCNYLTEFEGHRNFIKIGRQRWLLSVSNPHDRQINRQKDPKTEVSETFEAQTCFWHIAFCLLSFSGRLISSTHCSLTVEEGGSCCKISSR